MKSKNKQLQKDQNGRIVMSPKSLEICCQIQDLFQTPQLNDKLYLHYKGFNKIENLHRFLYLKALWLNNNAISKIQNLEYNQQLVTLYLNNNIITKIENLNYLEQLTILNLSYNRISKIENLQPLKKLHTLNLSYNLLTTSENLVQINECPSINNLDLSNNQIQNHDSVYFVLRTMKKLACLYLKNTPFAREFKTYRKKLISALNNLKFLDDRPVTQNQRRVSEAWLKGGSQCQNLEKIKIGQDREKYNKKVFEDFEKLAGPPRRKRKQIFDKLASDKIKQLQGLETRKLQIGNNKQSTQTISSEILKISDYLMKLEEAISNISVNQSSNADDFLLIFEDDRIKLINSKQIQQLEVKIEDLSIKEQLKEVNQQEKTIQQVIKQKVQIQKQQPQKVVSEEKENISQSEIIPIKLIENEQEEEQRLCLKKWNRKLQPILQLLLEKYMFDFEEVYPDFNMIITQIYKKLGKPVIRFQAQELRNIWTIIEKQKRLQLNKNK